MKQSLKKLEWLVKKSFVRYALGLVLSKDQKVCTKIARLFSISHDSIYRYLSKNMDIAACFPSLMIALAKRFHEKSPGWFIVDDTALSKIYAKYIEGINWIYNSSLKRPEKGLCIVVIAWTNGDITIPIGFEWWHSKKICKDKHKTKIKIAQELICKVAVEFDNFLADAAYISLDMIQFLYQRKIKFVTRIHSNRKVQTEDGICEQMKKHPKLRLSKNCRSKIVKVTMKGQPVNIVVFKRKKKSSCEYETVFLVTNIDASPKEIIKSYRIRWEIEPMFRAMKQLLGLTQCSARSLDKQCLHINTVFFDFAFIQNVKFNNKLASVEEAVRHLQCAKLKNTTTSFNRFCREFQQNA